MRLWHRGRACSAPLALATVARALLYNDLGRAPGISAGTRCAYGGAAQGPVAWSPRSACSARWGPPAATHLQVSETRCRSGWNPGPSQVITDLALISSGE